MKEQRLPRVAHIVTPAELSAWADKNFDVRNADGTPAKFPLALAEELLSPELAEMRKKYLPPLSDSIQVRDFNYPRSCG